MKKVVRVAPKLILGAEHLEPTKMEKATRVRQQDGDLRISRVIDSVHFVEKRDGPLLQLADACAFGFRRYFSNQTHGADFVRSMLAKSLVAEDWAGGISGGLFVRNPNNFTAQMIPVWRA